MLTSLFYDLRHNTVHCSLFTVHFSLLTSHFSLPTAHRSPLTDHCSLFTVHCSLFTAHCHCHRSPATILNNYIHTKVTHIRPRNLPHYFLLPNNLDKNPLLAFPVKFPIENLLPGAEIEFTFRDGYNHFTAHYRSLQVCIGVVLETVMTVL